MSLQFSPGQIANLEQEIFQIRDKLHFEKLALKVFAYQYEVNSVYRTYCDYLKRTPENVNHITELPYLPIEFFKTQTVISGNDAHELFFESSGTTGQDRSRHFIKSADLYRNAFLTTFQRFYGSPDDFYILALLPSYLENKHSSLIFMVNELIQQSGHKESGFYLDNLKELAENLSILKKRSQKILLLGVSFALLELAERYPMDLSDVTIMETGGMKGRREELTRHELHHILRKSFQTSHIHSEYGMAELLTQAYSKGDGLFETPPWMHILVREYNDPFHIRHKPDATEISGGVNIIDLANLHSCAFIETKDIGKIYKDGTFEILGRFDYSDVRGCNLLVME